MENIEPTTLGLMVVLTIIVMKFTEQMVSYLFAKLVKDDLITRTHCNACKSEQKTGDVEFRNEVREKLSIIIGAIVVMAAGKEVSIEEIQNLIKSSVQR